MLYFFAIKVDNMFRFWYRFVPENNSIIGRGAAAKRRIFGGVQGSGSLVGGLIHPPAVRQRSILWASRIRILHCLESANGQMKRWMRAF